MNVTIRGGLVTRFATALSVIVVLGIASSASAVFTENFNSSIDSPPGAMPDGGTVAGENGWTFEDSSGGNGIGFIGGGHNSAPLPSLNLNPGGSYDGTQSGIGAENAGFGIGIGRNIEGDKAGNGSYEAVFDVFVPAGSGVRVGIGTEDSILRSNVAHEMHWFGVRKCPTTQPSCESGDRGIIEVSTFLAANDPDGAETAAAPNSAGNEAANKLDPSINVNTDWFQVRLQTDSSGFLTWSHRPLGTTPWLLPTSSTVALTNGADDVQALMIGGISGEVDNLVSGADPSMGPATDFTWNVNSFGDWTTARNWQPATAFPGDPEATSSANHTATFGSVITSNRTVITETGVSVRGIIFDNSNTYSIAGSGSVNLIAATAAGPPPTAITVNQGTHQFQAAVNLHTDTTVNVASDSTLIFNSALELNSRALTKTGLGEIAIRNDFLTSGGTLNCDQGTCSGSGTISGDVNNGGGMISPGNSLGVTEVRSVAPEPSTGLLGFLGMVAVFRLRPSRGHGGNDL